MSLVDFPMRRVEVWRDANGRRRMVVGNGRLWQVRLIWNWPTFAFSRGCWRYTPDIDSRRSFSRTRVGPVKIEVTRW